MTLDALEIWFGFNFSLAFAAASRQSAHAPMILRLMAGMQRSLCIADGKTARSCEPCFIYYLSRLSLLLLTKINLESKLMEHLATFWHYSCQTLF
jgi:hypothetical protein